MDSVGPLSTLADIRAATDRKVGFRPVADLKCLHDNYRTGETWGASMVGKSAMGAALAVALLALANEFFLEISLLGLSPKQIAILAFIPAALLIYVDCHRSPP